jgi:hypothetical protein
MAPAALMLWDRKQLTEIYKFANPVQVDPVLNDALQVDKV